MTNTSLLRNLQKAIIVMVVLTILEGPTFRAVDKASLEAAEAVVVVVIIEAARLPTTVQQQWS